MLRIGGSRVQTPETSKTRESCVELMQNFCGKLSDVACEQQIFFN